MQGRARGRCHYNRGAEPKSSLTSSAGPNNPTRVYDPGVIGAERVAERGGGLLAGVQQGDRRAFERLVAAHYRELHVHCYRMLGSLHEADDATQETMMRAWRALPQFDGRWLRAWLYKIATNVCIDIGGRRPPRAISLDSPDPLRDDTGEVSLDPYPDHELAPQDERVQPEARYEAREAIELAFVAALQLLPPRQRAVLILREVLGYSAVEVAELLDVTVASVNSALQRARAGVEKRLPQRSQHETLRSMGDARVHRLAQSFAEAWDRGDVDAMVALLTQDVVFTTVPEPPRRGADAVEAFLPARPGRWRLVPSSANGQLAFGAYRWDPAASRHRAAVLDVVVLRDEKIGEVVAFSVPQLFERFALPASVPARAPAGVGSGS
jgi:RNA polymerase sigma-70 factor (ECF subfamily)